MIKHILLGIFLFSLVALPAQQRVQFAPIKEKITDTSLKSFIDTLKGIVKRKDASKIYTLLDAKIINQPTNSNDGIRYFKKYWQPQKKNSLWETLKLLLTWGGKYSGADKKEFLYPYFLYEEIKDGEKDIDYFVVQGNNITLHQEATAKSKVVTKLSYEAVAIVYDSMHKNTNPNWEYVETLDHQYKGFIKRKFLYSFYNYHMLLDKEKGKWKIKALTEGS
jgi:hypothetical protein